MGSCAHPVGSWSPSTAPLQCRPIPDHQKPGEPLTIRAERPPASSPSHRAETGRPERGETCPRASSAAIHSMDCSPSQYLVLMAMTWTVVAQQGFQVLRGVVEGNLGPPRESSWEG